MKSFCTKMFLAAAVCLTMAHSASAQSYLEDPKWGGTPEERTQNAMTFNLLRDTYENQNYNDALGYIEKMVENAPKASANTYVWAINIYKNKAARATSLSDKNMFIDSLMTFYDLRTEHFGDDPTRGRPYILSLKAIDYLNYRPSDADNIIKYFREAIDANGLETDADFVNMYFSVLTEEYKADNIEMEEYLNEYESLENIIRTPENLQNEIAGRTFEALFLSSGAANCENLEILFGKRIEEDPENMETIGKALALLDRGNCRGDFFLKVAEMYYEMEPSSNTALILAAGYEEKKDYDKALRYLNAAYTSETDPELKLNLAVRIAGSELGAGNSSSAAQYARQAIAINPESGLAYYILAQAYAAGVNGCSGFNRSSAYWLVYDTLVTAKRYLGDSDARVGNIDSQIANYRASFPSSEECFFRGLSEGEGFTVSCGWVSGRTTVRVGR